MRQHQRSPFIVSYLVAALLLPGCGMLGALNPFGRGRATTFADESKWYADAGAAYKDEGVRVQGLCQSGKLNADDCAVISDDQRAVRLASRKYSAILRAWGAAGGRRSDKPGRHDDLKAELVAAIEKLTADIIVAEVQ